MGCCCARERGQTTPCQAGSVRGKMSDSGLCGLIPFPGSPATGKTILMGEQRAGGETGMASA